MIYGIGVDLVHIPRITSIMSRWDERFLDRVFTPEEQTLCLSRPRPDAAFAQRFAAKEAFSKAIGTGMRQGVAWRDIEVFHLPGGRPAIRVFGGAQTHCLEKNITQMHVSLSDEIEYAMATVILEQA